MKNSKAVVFAIFTVISITSPTFAAVGTRAYGQKCVNSLVAGIGLAKEIETCNGDKNLVCLGSTCVCNPAEFVYQNGVLGVELLGGGCRLRASFPCTYSNTACVANSQCKTICQCDKGYQMDRTGKCVSSGGGININILNLTE